jgi:hypothetical protein
MNTLKIEAIHSLRTLVTSYKTTLHHNKEGHNLHFHNNGKLKSVLSLLWFSYRQCQMSGLYYVEWS